MAMKNHLQNELSIFAYLIGRNAHPLNLDTRHSIWVPFYISDSQDILQSLPHEYPQQPAYQLCYADTLGHISNP